MPREDGLVIIANDVEHSPNWFLDQTLFAAYQDGIYKSTYETTFTRVLDTSAEGPVTEIEVSPNYEFDQTVYASVDNGGVKWSNDGGTTWSSFTFSTNRAYSIAMSPNFYDDSTGTVYVGTNNGKFYRNNAVDTDTAWTDIADAGTGNNDVKAAEIDPDWGSSNSLFYTAWTKGAYKSVDGGATWSLLNAGNDRHNGMGLSQDFANDNVMFLANQGSGIFRSIDGGTSFISINGTIGNNINDATPFINIEVSDYLFVAGEQGVWMDSGTNPTTLGNTFIQVGDLFAVGGAQALKANDVEFAHPHNHHLWSATQAGVYHFEFIHDSTAPITMLETYPTTTTSSGWFNQDTTFTLTSDEPGGTFFQWDATDSTGWTYYTESTVALEGIHTLYFWSTDYSGNNESVQSQLFQVDTIAPTVIANSPTGSGVSQNTLVTAAFDDTMTASTVNSSSFTLEDSSGTAVPANVSYNGVIRTATLDPNSALMSETTYTVRVKTTVQDKAENGLTSEYSWSFFTAAGPPTTVLTTEPIVPGANGWFNTDTTITLSVTSGGPATTYYRWDGDGTNTVFSGGINVPDTDTVFYYFSIGSGGTESENNVTIKKDTIDPLDPTLTSPSHSTDTPSNNPSVTINLAGATDTLSGVDGYSVLWDTNPGTSPDQTKDLEYGLNSTTTVLSDGSNHYFHVATVDNAGNWTSTVHIGPFVIDTVAPTGSITIDSGAAYTVSTTVTVSNTVVGAAEMRYSNDGSSWSSWESYAASKTWNLTSGDGLKTVYAEFRDAALNVLSVTDNITLDQSPPASVAPVTDDGAYTTNNTQLSASWSASSDGESGIAAYEYSIGTSPGATDVVGWTSNALSTSVTRTGLTLTNGATYYINARAKNGAGTHSAVASSNGIIIDSLAPAVTSTSPLNGAVDVIVNSNVTATFNDDMNASTIDGAGFTLEDASGTLVSATITYNGGTKTALLDPTGNLSDGTVYTAELNTGITDKAGNNLVLAYQWSFTTKPADTTPPSTPILVGFAPSSTTINLDWLPATDNEGVVGYEIYDAGTGGLLTTVSLTNHSFSGLTPTVTYSYYIKALDAAGNKSSPSNVVTIKPGRGGTTPGSGSTEESVTVTPLSEISVTFSDTNCDGTTTVSKNDSYSFSPPMGYRFIGDEYEIQHNPGCYIPPIIVAIDYDPNLINGDESLLKMFHKPAVGPKRDVTLYVDEENNVIVGRLMSLSPVILGVPGSPATGLNQNILIILAIITICGGVILRKPATKRN